ncbi:LPXTG cell wall anchor domain-containing protein [Enterococcus sp. AZ196]|uniref:LPXTG cell wall anchor domain-containing protein n=1 Tax=Enterococcus sp. AZ196 TaxID=2774659 RepID=UPI003D275580
MKKIISALTIIALSLICSSSVLAESFNSIEKPSGSISDGDTWVRDVGDGTDTYTFKQGEWLPKVSSSIRRSEAKERYNKDVYEPNRIKQSLYIDNALKDPDAFKTTPENEVEYLTLGEGNEKATVRIPKIEVDSKKANSSFYIDELVPLMLTSLVSTYNNSASSDSADSGSTVTSTSISSSTIDTSKESVETTSTTDLSAESSIDINTSVALTIRAEDHTYDVKVGKKLTREDLLKIVEYDGDKNNLKVTISNSAFVYVTPNAEVYHVDLDDLLSKTSVSRITVMTEQEALKKGLRMSTENNDKNIENINLSLPGKYNVMFEDSNVSTNCIVTVKGAVTSQSSDNSNNNRVSSNEGTLSKTAAGSNLSTQKVLPKTGDRSNSFLIIGLMSTLGALGLFYVSNRK